MAALYVENVPDELYEALRKRARAGHRSMGAEITSLLKQNIPTEKELRSRRGLVQKLSKLCSRGKSKKRFPTTEEMLRQDRAR
jgi:plasmid stability protein